MNWKKLAILDQFPYCASPQRKVVSGFGVGLVASLFVLSVVLFNVSFEAPFLSPMFQGFNTSRVKNRTSGVSLPLSFSNTSVFSSSTSTTSSAASSVASNEELQNSVDVRQGVGEGRVVDETQEANVSVVSKKGDVLGSNGEGISLGDNNGSFTRVEGRVKDKTQFVNASVTGKNANFTISEGAGVGLGTTHVGNSSGEVKNGSFSGDVGAGKSVNDSSLNKNTNNVTENGNGANLSYRIENVGCPGKDVLCSHFDNQKLSSEKNNITVSSKDNHLMARQKGLYENCDIFDGRWVREDTERYYPAGSCPYIDRDFDCHLNGRKDDLFLKWKWKPYGCDVPSLNATDFLERLRGKKLVFVGDSLNRNMWESLVCILRQSVRNKKRVHEISGKKEFKKNGFYAFRYEDYNCTVDFVGAPFLVRESSFQRRNGSMETLRLDLMDRTTSMYCDADIVVFNTGHWWTHEKTSRGEDYYQEGSRVYPRLKVLEAYKRALTTWARWVDQNIDGTRTQVIYRGYSGTHFRGGQWNSGGKCHKETEPIFNKAFLAKYPSKMRVLEHILRKMKTPVIYLNISRLTDYRKDGHPSIYRQKYKTVEEQIAAEHSQDCSHWCLPGVPDTWNELLYASLLQAGKGSWRR